MFVEVPEAAVDQLPDQGAEPLPKWVTLEERLLLRFYRQLGAKDRVFILRALEAAAAQGTSD